ncbi:zinc ABC transporter ATP-binding protein ZnuC [Marinobacteraceae bacterium S3BR75-40.1]
MTDPLVSLQQATVHFGGAPVIDRVDLDIHPGDVITLIGPNGAGKTTLIRTVLGIQKPSTGRVQRRKGLRMGYMPQHIHLQPTLPLPVARFLSLTDANRAEQLEALERVGVSHLHEASIHRLSGGEMQRVLLARAILRRPDLLVLDEPAQGVDVTGQAALYGLIQEIRDELGCAVLTISHDLHLVMAATDRVICLNQHICCSGPPEQVSNDPAFIDLFGRPVAESLAVYHHYHNHRHDLHGDVAEAGAGAHHHDG